MTYANLRIAEIQAMHAVWLKKLMEDFDPDLPTVILLPDAMGSMLDGTRNAFDDPEFEKYETKWIDFGISLGDAADLPILNQPQRPDAGMCIVRATGPIQLCGMSPYDHTERFFRRGQPRRANYVVFAYDWRRDLRESANLLKQFLERFRAQAMGANPSRNPLSTATLVGHGMGGQVVKLFLQAELGKAHSDEEIEQWMARFISVGTPFFGSPDHQRRYYEGAPPARSLIGGKAAMAKLVATLPGFAALLPLDIETWRALKDDLKLPRYPSRDSETEEEADPRDPTNFERYPYWIDHYRDFLAESRRVQAEIAAPLPPVVANRCFHLRSSLNTTTPTSFSWGWLQDRGHFDPTEEPTPIRTKAGVGDGTVPAWSAVLPSTPDANRVELKRAAHHGSLLEHPEVLESIWGKVRNDFVRPALPEDSVAKKLLEELSELTQAFAASPVRTPTSIFELEALRTAGEQGRHGIKKLLYRLLE
jgi:pimeloyl-ACP methyl ester carboxylesterase